MTDLDMKLIDKYNEIGRSFYWEGTLGEEDCQEEALAFAREIKRLFHNSGYHLPKTEGAVCMVVDSNDIIQYARQPE